jgi:hypothetical protein
MGSTRRAVYRQTQSLDTVELTVALIRYVPTIITITKVPWNPPEKKLKYLRLG